MKVNAIDAHVGLSYEQDRRELFRNLVAVYGLEKPVHHFKCPLAVPRWYNKSPNLQAAP